MASCYTLGAKTDTWDTADKKTARRIVELIETMYGDFEMAVDCDP